MNPLKVYKASAGSGKTFTLAVEYIKLLVLSPGGDEYNHILAVTFTNKATSEMKDRILTQLFGIAHGLPSSQVYYDKLVESLRGEPDAPTQEAEIRRRCGEALHQILHDYSHFRVGTIDSFFQTILRGLAHELGLTANLQVEINDSEVLSKAVDRIVYRLQDEPVVLDWLMSLVRDQIEMNQRWDVTHRVKEFGRAIFNEEYLRRGDQLRQVLSDGAFVRSFIKELKTQEQDAVATLQGYAQQIEDVLTQSGLSCDDFSNGQRILGGMIERLKAGDVASMEPTETLQKWADDPLKMVRRADMSRSDLMDAADTISGILAEFLDNLKDLQSAYNSARLVLAHIKPLFLLDFIDREVAEINAETSRFNLAKTPILLNRMVGDSDAPFVFEKIGALLHHVMIDEFQDTSRLQWENFRTLLLESYSRGGRNLIVGDVKQSIYRWRGGDWRTLGQIEKNVIPAPQVENLDTNYRSMRRVVDFNNDFFTKAVQELERVSTTEETLLNLPGFFATAYSDVAQKTPGSKENTGHVRVRVLSSKDYHSREAWEPVVLDEFCQTVLQLHADGLPYQAMAILVRNNSECETIVRAFAEIPEMPAVISDEAFLLSSCQPVVLLINALRFLVEEENPMPRYFLEENGVDVQLLTERRSELRFVPLYELLEQLYNLLDLHRFSGQEAYLFGFFDAVSDYLRGESADIQSFLSYWDERLCNQAVPAGEVDGIRILTIHKSKGLEFHTVLMPFCTWDLERDHPGNLLWCSPTEEPYAAMQLLPITPTSKVTSKSVFAKDYAEAHLLSRMDELNALYVGFTRARANLLIWCVGTDLNRDSRSVGDLIACVVSNVAPCIADGLYYVGQPVTEFSASKHEEENRMSPNPEPQAVEMQSYDLSVTFRQSNQSARFMAEQGGEEAPPEEELTRRRFLETGRLLHRVLQSIRVEDDVDAVLDNFERQGLISRTAADGTEVAVPRAHMEKWVRQGLRNPLVRDWFQPHWQLFNECSIVSLDADGVPQVHRPDRVMISPDGLRIVVVDFKFGVRRQEYDEQVRGYMQLLSSMSPQAHVEGFLWFVYSGKVERVNASGNNTHAESLQLSFDF